MRLGRHLQEVSHEAESTPQHYRSEKSMYCKNVRPVVFAPNDVRLRENEGREIGMSGTSVGNLLELSQSAVNRAAGRGEKLSQELNLSLITARTAFSMAVPLGL